MDVVQIQAFADNYIYLLRDPQSGATSVVDPGSDSVVRSELERRGWGLHSILCTHHHPDHVGGVLKLKKEYSAVVYGAEKDRRRIPGLDKGLNAEQRFYMGSECVEVFEVDGHTIGHILFWLPESRILFCGDTLFSLGCGKLFEGTPQEMWVSLEKIRKLPPDTLIYCAHEYTLENAEFALRVEPGNRNLHKRVQSARRLRDEGKSTVPVLLQEELETNPFLRPESAEIQRNLDADGLELWEIFAKTRITKDRFDSGLSWERAITPR